MEGIPYAGEAFALASALCWSTAIILFRKAGERVTPLALNLFKNVLAVALYSVTLLAVGQTAPEGVTGSDWALLLASGVIGIGLSDTLFFMCLNRIGAGLQSIVNTSYSPSVILMGVLFLGDRLSLWQVVGVALILNAVVSVGWMKEPAGGRSRRTVVVGVLLGIGATTTQAVSIAMIKPLLDQAPLIWATWVRLLAGLVASVFFLPLMANPRRELAALRDLRVWPVMIPGAIMGTYVSLLFWMAGMKYTQISTASALNQMSTIFTFVLAALLLREPVTRMRVLGVILGTAGVLMVILCAPAVS